MLGALILPLAACHGSSYWEDDMMMPDEAAEATSAATPSADEPVNLDKFRKENLLGSSEPRGLVPAPEEEPVPEHEPAPLWECFYDPTYNYDWHDDVLCTNGLEYDRPILIPWDDYVEYEEIMEAAMEYEAELNGAR